MNIRIGRVEINLLALPLWLLISVWNAPKMLILLLSCAAVHEAGHFLAVLLTRAKIESFRLGVTGASIRLEETLLSYRKEIWIYLSGGLFNLLYAVVCFFIMRIEFCDSLLFLFFCNLFYFVFNLLPIGGLDGGEALRAWLNLKSDPIYSDEICRSVSIVGVICLFFTSCFLLFWSKCNLSLLMICLSLMINLQNETAGGRKNLSGEGKRIFGGGKKQ